MKVILLLVSLSAIVWARPQGQNPADARLVRYEFDQTGYGGYRYSYETSDGASRDETAEVVNQGTENEYLKVSGSYSYVGPDGVTYTVTYTADEEGFQPSGAHIPPSAGVKPQLGIPSAALASLAGGGLG